ncbi:MAG: tetratricopeptide repeat protein [Candidatus Eisenbacteria bacterium]
MGHRPAPGPEPRFDEALELARSDGFAAAVAHVLARLPHGRGSAPHRAAAANALARIARHAESAGDIAAAESAFAEAVRLAPTFPDLRHHHGRMLLQQQRRAEARRELTHALKLSPRYTAARVELALLDAREGLLARSLDALHRLGEEARLAEPRAFRKGLASLASADWHEAEALLKQALQLADPGVENIIETYHRLSAAGDVAGAAELVRQALGDREGYADLHYLLGTAEFECGHYDDALGSLARALELHPDYHAARVMFARALEALGDAAQAVEQLGLVLQAEPDHPQASELHEAWIRRRAKHAV